MAQTPTVMMFPYKSGSENGTETWKFTELGVSGREPKCCQMSGIKARAQVLRLLVYGGWYLRDEVISCC